MRLLVVEDELRLAEYLRKGLSEEGYAVDVARSGVDGLHLALEGTYDLIVLDRMLPGLDGLSLLAGLRQIRTTPVLMLTARIGVEERVRGLKAGADDYLVKPFSFSELLARIEVLLRRSCNEEHPDAVSHVLELGDLILEPSRAKASRSGQCLELSAREFQLLTLLLQRQGEVLSRKEIAERVWDMNFDSGTQAVDAAINRLRAKIDAPFSRPLLHTVRGMGYVLEIRDL